MQLTGKDNYRQFRNWCRAAGLDCPDFVKDPDAVNTEPWEGLVPLFYWDTRDLNRWATSATPRRSRRRSTAARTACLIDLTGWPGSRSCCSATAPTMSFSFRLTSGFKSTAMSGRKRTLQCTRRLWRSPQAARPEVKAAPVTEEKPVPVPVTPPSLDAPWWKSKEVITPSVIGGGASLLTAIGGITWQNLLLILVAFGGHCRLSLLAQERRSEGRRKTG
ncbi:hypothetical protein [Sinorhizobium meliloti]|uniref:hypothetical protein n=1 Tax=Rhizobium meliloti TaxID=382 RepID=UPI001F2BF8FE|nr:hypothetical protein [Sinorhizobium meliloti]